MSDSVVLEKVQKRIQELEQAIHHLDFVKRHLNQNSSQIKSQIHTSISRHLETLRNREVWLLGQVDTVLGVKEEVLHQQQARLNKTLGILHSSLAHATSSTDDDDTATKHLTHALEELSSSELKADETPYIAFRADHVALRESIMSYGRVDAKGLPLQSAFADASKPSASLPRHFEEYEDSEHHFFYKALQEAKTGCSDDSNQITVTMPKLSSRVEDWLQRPVLQLFTTESGDKGQLMTPSEANKTVDTAKHSTCSIQNWLSQIKHNPDFEEEDDFEIVDHSSQRESPVDELKLTNSLVGKSELAFKEETVDLFSHIPRDLRHWLNKRVDLSPIEENLRDFFKHIPKETSLWLAKAQQQFASLDELKKGGWFRHISTDPSTWLRRAFDRKSTVVTAQQSPSVTDFFAHIPRDNSIWLINKDSSEGMEVETREQKPEFVIKWETESFLSRVPTIADVTPAARYSQQDTMKKLTPAVESQSCQPSRTAVPESDGAEDDFAVMTVDNCNIKVTYDTDDGGSFAANAGRLDKKSKVDFICSCKLNNHQPCSLRFSNEELKDLRQTHQSLKKDDLDLIVLAQIQSGIHDGKMTECSKQKNQTERKKVRVEYCYRGHQICRDTFMFIYGIFKDRLTNLIAHYQQNGVTTRIHGNTKKTSHNALTYGQGVNVRFIQNFAVLPAPTTSASILQATQESASEPTAISATPAQKRRGRPKKSLRGLAAKKAKNN